MDNRTTIQVSEDMRKQLKILAAQRDAPYDKILQDMVDVFKELDNSQTIISIPIKLAEKTKQTLKDSEFSSISEFVTFLLRIMLYEKTDISPKNIEKVRERLKKLGYIE